MTKMKRFVVLISENGSHLQTIIDAQKVGKISGVICNKTDAYGLVRAKERLAFQALCFPVRITSAIWQWIYPLQNAED